MKQLQTLRSQMAVALVGGALLAPLLGTSTSSQAAPASTWGNRNRNDSRPNQNRVVIGTVITDMVGRDRFTVRLNNGRTSEVISRRNEPLRLSRGDLVELRGDFESNLFIADSVRILRNNGSGTNNGQQTTVRGRVVRDYAGREFEIRTDNGRSVTVRSERSEPIRLSNGDRVEMRGQYQRGIFLARDVDILRNDDRLKVDFPATVIRREGGNRMVVRSDNGRTYTVVSNFSLTRYDRNDRVRVQGYASNSIVTASDVDLLRNR